MISLIVFIVVAGIAYWLLTLLPLPDPFPTVLKVVFVLLCLLFLLQFFGLWSPGWAHPVVLR